jgi:hypothetical protein
MKTTVYCDIKPQWYKTETNFSIQTTENDMAHQRMYKNTSSTQHLTTMQQ